MEGEVRAKANCQVTEVGARSDSKRLTFEMGH